MKQNAQNRPANRCNKLGVKGVHLNRRDGKFYAKIRVSGKNVHLGVFDDCEDAAKAYANAATATYGQFANCGGRQWQ